MITLEQIHAEQLRAAAEAARERREPLTIWPADLATPEATYGLCRGIPFLGNYIPRGYKRVNVQDVLPYHLDYFFVDAMGGWENTHHEAALSIGEFREMLMELLQIDNLEHPIGLDGRYDVSSSYSLGIWEVGQFQVNIALYRGTQW